jgi:hypothetical protein
MRTKETIQNFETQTDEVAEAPQVEGAVAGNHELQAKDERHERIMEYLRSSLAMKDPLAANVGAVNSDLMLFGYSLRRAISKALDMTPDVLDQFGKLMPAMEAYMRISKQVERFTKLNQQLARAEKAVQAGRATHTCELLEASEETAS